MNYDKALGVAIANYLSDWDDDLSNEQIINALRDEDYDKVTVWEPFEDYDGSYVADHIETLAQDIHEYSESKDEVERDYARTLANGSMTGSR